MPCRFGEFTFFFGPDSPSTFIKDNQNILLRSKLKRANDPKDRRKTIVEPTRNKKLEGKFEMIFTPLHERMHKFLSSYSNSELTFLPDTMTKLIEQTREESKRLRKSRKYSVDVDLFSDMGLVYVADTGNSHWVFKLTSE